MPLAPSPTALAALRDRVTLLRIKHQQARDYIKSIDGGSPTASRDLTEGAIELAAARMDLDEAEERLNRAEARAERAA